MSTVLVGGPEMRHLGWPLDRVDHVGEPRDRDLRRLGVLIALGPGGAGGVAVQADLADPVHA